MRSRLMLVLICITLSGCWEHGTGEKIGVITRLNKQGFICKTWEAEIIRGGMTGGSGVMGIQPFEFTIENNNSATKLQELMRQQKEVKITYHEEVFTLCRSDSGSYFLETIEELEK